MRTWGAPSARLADERTRHQATAARCKHSRQPLCPPAAGGDQPCPVGWRVALRLLPQGVHLLCTRGKHHGRIGLVVADRVKDRVDHGHCGLQRSTANTMDPRRGWKECHAIHTGAMVYAPGIGTSRAVESSSLPKPPPQAGIALPGRGRRAARRSRPITARPCRFSARLVVTTRQLRTRQSRNTATRERTAADHHRSRRPPARPPSTPTPWAFKVVRRTIGQPQTSPATFGCGVPRPRRAGESRPAEHGPTTPAVRRSGVPRPARPLTPTAGG